MSDNDHEHRAYQVWDGDNHWAPANLAHQVQALASRVSVLEETLADLDRRVPSE